jgi:hypothetical protein
MISSIVTRNFIVDPIAMSTMLIVSPPNNFFS